MTAKRMITTKHFVLAVGVTWFLVAFLIKVGLISPETVQSYCLGGKGGLFPIQLLTYSFIYPHYSWFEDFLWISIMTLWLWGLSSNSSDWLDTAGFVRLYSLATLVVGGICWAFARTIHPDVVFSGAWPVIGTMLGAIAARDHRRKTTIWGNGVRNRLRHLAAAAPAALWIPALVVVAVQCGSGWPSSGVDRVAVAVLRFSWLVWSLLAMAEMRAITVCIMWFVLLLPNVAASWVLSGTFPLAFIVNIVIPLAVGIGYGTISRGWAMRKP